MKIARIETFAVNVTRINNWSFVRITADDGTQGLGEMTLNSWEPVQQAFLGMMKPGLIGMPPEEALGRVTVYPHSQGGQAANSVLSALEQALCDLLARAAGQPLHAWLGGARRKQVRVYANIDRRTLDRTPAGFAAQAKKSVALGYNAVKITPFAGLLAGNIETAEGRQFIRAGLERIYATRQAIGPDVDLLVDCHWRFNEAKARELVLEIEAACPFWIECIISENPEQRAALGRVRGFAEQHGIRLAGAERQMGIAGFNPFIEDHLLDVLMPDVKYAGGCREMVNIARAGAARGLAFSPHNPASPLCSLASMHVCAVVDDVLILEHQIAENERYRDIINEPLLALQNGCWTVPDTPGLGVTLNEETIRAHPATATALDARMDPALADTGGPLARRVAEVAPFHVMELLARARELEAQGRTIVHMEIGEPDFPTAKPICDAGIRAIENGQLFYTPALGIPELRAAISRFYRERYGVEVPASRIIITSGASGALLLAIGVLINPGDEVLMADPGYPCNRNFVRMMGGVPAEVAVGAESAYQLLPEMVARHWTPNTKAVMVASPSNPTGTLMPAESLRAIAEITRERGGALIVDEIYHGLVYDGEYTTALKHSDDVFVINSFSKYFNMTGWRLGWMVVPEPYVREFDKLSQNIYLSAPTAAQHAALAAFEPATLAILEERRSEFKTRRDFLVPALRGLGFRVPVVPPGAFYIYADCSALTKDSFAFARDLLETAGVAITPGADFGVHGAERHVRFAYTNSIPVLAEGVKRIGEYIARR